MKTSEKLDVKISKVGDSWCITANGSRWFFDLRQDAIDHAEWLERESLLETAWEDQ